MAKKRGKPRKKARKKPNKNKQKQEITPILNLFKHHEHANLEHETKKHINIPLLVFIFSAIIILVFSIIRKDWLVTAALSLIIIIGLFFLKKNLKINAIVKKHNSTFYLINWISSLILLVLSIARLKLLSGIIAACVMFSCSLISSISSRKIKTLDLTKDIDELQKSEKKYETDLDKMMTLLKKYKKLKISEISRGFGVTADMVEEWADILEKHNLLIINFPAFSGMEISIKKEEKNEKQ